MYNELSFNILPGSIIKKAMNNSYLLDHTLNAWALPANLLHNFFKLSNKLLVLSIVIFLVVLEDEVEKLLIKKKVGWCEWTVCELFAFVDALTADVKAVRRWDWGFIIIHLYTLILSDQLTAFYSIYLFSYFLEQFNL